MERAQNRTPRRENGFSRPLHWLQVLSWSTFIILVAVYYAVLVSIVDGLLLILLAVVHAVLAIGTLWFAYKTCAKNPVDDRDYTSYVVGDGERLSHCHICQQAVKSQSKHCRLCDKCVEGFDHHCMWLNNCIGSKNYRDFMWTLAFSFLLICMESITSLTAFALYLRSAIQNNEHLGFTIFLGVYLLVSVGVALSIGQLFFFHLYLLRAGKTTYDHIVETTRKQHEKLVKGDLKKTQTGQEKTGNSFFRCFWKKRVISEEPEVEEVNSLGSDGSEKADSKVSAIASEQGVSLV